MSNKARIVTVAAWACIIVIAYATLTRVGFVYAIYFKLAPILMHLELKTYAVYEHVLAFAVMGALFTFAYPRRPFLVCCIVLGGAMLLEVLQTLTPDRHGTLMDALQKIAGGVAGIVSTKCLLYFRANDQISAGKSEF